MFVYLYVDNICNYSIFLLERLDLVIYIFLIIVILETRLKRVHIINNYEVIDFFFLN